MLKKFKAYAKSLFYEKKEFNTKTVDIQGNLYLLKELTKHDIKDLLSVEREVYNGELPWTKSVFLAELKSPFQNLYLGIFDGEKLFGFVGARVFGMDCHITNIAVIPSYQRKNIGTLLIDEIENFSIINRCETLSLEVKMSNQDAQRLYRKLGFQSKKVKKGYYTQTNEDGLEMIKILENE
jgi:ribosomal-protein-alanine N-acetyltransferase